jgi:penicillin-binding protein 1A
MSKSKDPFSKLKNNARRVTKKTEKDTQGVRVNRSVTEKVRAHKDKKARKKAEYLASLPKNPVKRFFYRLSPKHFAEYWFNRDGGIRALKILGIGLAVLMVMTLALFAYFRKDLPKDITELKACSEGASTTYYDRTGETLLWASSGDVECYPVSQENISDNLEKAVVASEDKDFYQHGGFSFTGIFRATFNNFTGGDVQGGSTITQQFVKNSLLSQERTIQRKLKELILALELERSYTKDEILNAYLNEIPFGSVYDGAEAASRGYFNKPAKELTIDEAALLTAVIPAPTFYSPYGENTDALLSQQQLVIDKMVAQGLITQEEGDKAKKVDTLKKLSKESRNKYKNIEAPYFVLKTQEKLEEKYGATNIRKAGFKVITSLDLRLQKVAEKTVSENMPRLAANNAENMAAVATDVKTGEVLALVGGRDFNYPGFGQKNMATSPRSPGSTMKPYDYAALMAKNESWGAGSIFYDVQTDFGGGYVPKNYDRGYVGPNTMRYFIGQSRNIPAIKAGYIAGVQDTIDLAKKMGLKSGSTCEPDCGLSATIGDGSEIKLDEHTNAYATFARGGKFIEQKYFLQVFDAKGKEIDSQKATDGEQVLDEQIAYIMNDILSDTNVSYFRNNYRVDGAMKSAIKTGTTNNNDNHWMVGYTPHISFGVWAGRQNDNNAMFGESASALGPVWSSFMNQAHDILKLEDKGFDKPNGIKTVCINQYTGYATANGGRCDIFPSWYQPQYPNSSKKAEIDKISKKLATDCTPPLARETITGGGIRAELPSSDPLYNNWMAPISGRYGAAGGAIPTAKDDIHTCDPADKPKVTLSVSGSDGTYILTADVKAGKSPLKTVNFKIDGVTLPGGSFNVRNSGPVSMTYTSTYNGSKRITVEVVDSILYEASASQTINLAKPSGSGGSGGGNGNGNGGDNGDSED